MNYATTVAALRERARAGLSLDESIVFLHDAGLPIVHSIKAIHEVFGLPLGEAKHVTAGHPVWAPLAKANQRLHDDLEMYADFIQQTEGNKRDARAQAYRRVITTLFPKLGLAPIPEDWSGVDPVLPLLERMRQEGAVVLVKWDGERTAPGDSGPYTVLVSGARLAGETLRADTHSLEEALARVIFGYALRYWEV
ncbi:hypothetical protein KYC5002_28020 [Archangium violaceum]|uniref:hypothetical protein n=1 Tax=Archangium violaceum TaxID=83451 RepID=UPI002B2B984A|nr:hypothetical protein KYC5002_28020 [Archangium gephyra]